MIGDIVGPRVATAEAFTDSPDAVLFPAEEAAVARAVAKRRNEFTTVRACAREALAQLGVAPVPILPGERGAPGWPDGIVGSMTHCDGYRGAAVARTGDVVTIGLDAEPDGPLPDGVLAVVSLPEEREHLSGLPDDRGVHWERLLFSAKESVYKAWFPLTRRWLDFLEARITIDPAGRFSARLLVPGPVVAGRELPGFEGRWVARDGLVATGITVRR
jgi:4'-phosphopantetheinyl transferase EntD